MIQPSSSVVSEQQSPKKASQEFSNQSTMITVNSELPENSKFLERVKSNQFSVRQNSTLQLTPMQMLKSALKSLQLNPSQQQLVINQVTQLIQQNKQRTVRSPSANKKMPPMNSPTKIPPLNRQSKQKRQQNKSKQKLSQLKCQSFINSFIKQTKNYHPIKKDDHAQFILQSSIIKSQEEVKKLTGFFNNLALKGFNLMFKASQNQFNLRSFFNQCGSMENLLIICKTNKDKMIGGYSPLFHEFTGKLVFDDKFGQKVKDSTKTSFIFSLTNNERFLIKNQAQAVYRFRDKKYLIFGDWQFSICDSSNTNKNCRTDNFNMNFMNEKYRNTKESWIKFNGNQDQHFMTKQWEAWKVQFQN